MAPSRDQEDLLCHCIIGHGPVAVNRGDRTGQLKARASTEPCLGCPGAERGDKQHSSCAQERSLKNCGLEGGTWTRGEGTADRDLRG